MNVTDFGSKRSVISPNPLQIPLEIVLIFTKVLDQFFILRNQGEKFVENRITFDPCPHIKSPLQIYVYAYKWLKNIGIVMISGINLYFVNLNHITKFCCGRFIIASKIGPLKKICLAIIISLKILLEHV